MGRHCFKYNSYCKVLSNTVRGSYGDFTKSPKAGLWAQSVKNDREGSKGQGFPKTQIKPPGHPGQHRESLSQNSSVRKGPRVLPRCVVTAYHAGDFGFHCQHYVQIMPGMDLVS